jgi:hypothetical protein
MALSVYPVFFEASPQKNFCSVDDHPEVGWGDLQFPADLIAVKSVYVLHHKNRLLNIFQFIPAPRKDFKEFPGFNGFVKVYRQGLGIHAFFPMAIEIEVGMILVRFIYRFNSFIPGSFPIVVYNFLVSGLKKASFWTMSVLGKHLCFSRQIKMYPELSLCKVLCPLPAGGHSGIISRNTHTPIPGKFGQ